MFEAPARERESVTMSFRLSTSGTRSLGKPLFLPYRGHYSYPLLLRPLQDIVPLSLSK